MNKQTQQQRDTQKQPPEPVRATLDIIEKPDRPMTTEEFLEQQKRTDH